MKYICKKFINHQIKKCLLFRCRHAVVIRPYNANFKLDQSVSAIHDSNQTVSAIHDYFGISEDDHTSLVSHARDH
jgi:hypothetical protein